MDISLFSIWCLKKIQSGLYSFQMTYMYRKDHVLWLQSPFSLSSLLHDYFNSNLKSQLIECQDYLYYLIDIFRIVSGEANKWIEIKMFLFKV